MEADKNIRFAGVIDDGGMLLVGEYRKDIESPLIKTNQLIDSGEISSTSSCGGIANSPFLASKLIFALNKQFEPDPGNLNYHLTEYDKVKLLTVALSTKAATTFAFQ